MQWSKWLFHPASALVFLSICGLMWWSLAATARKTRNSTEAVGILEQENAKIARDVSELENQLKTASSSTNHEKIIRNELLMQKPGEYVLQIPDLPALPDTHTPVPTPTAWQQWQKIWRRQ